MQKEVSTLAEAEALVKPLMDEKKWAITVIQRKDETFLVQWVEHKKYTAHDGAEYHDEVWTTQEGKLMLVQDLEPEHARNIIRMMLRNERERSEALKAIYDGILEGIAEDDGLLRDPLDDNPPILH